MTNKEPYLIVCLFVSHLSVFLRHTLHQTDNAGLAGAHVKAAAISKDKALAKGAADLAQQHERAAKAERMCSLFCFTQFFTQFFSVAGKGWTSFFRVQNPCSIRLPVT